MTSLLLCLCFPTAAAATDLSFPPWPQALVGAMDEQRLDALVYPTWGRPPLRVGDRPADAYDGNNSPLVAPHTGSPAISVPMGYTGGLLAAWGNLQGQRWGGWTARSWHGRRLSVLISAIQPPCC